MEWGYLTWRAHTICYKWLADLVWLRLTITYESVKLFVQLPSKVQLYITFFQHQNLSKILSLWQKKFHFGPLLLSAPPGCLQYHTGTSGTIESFNFDGGVHLANQYYSICIRTEEGYCEIAYTKTTFSLSSGNTVEGDDCTEDYLIIPDNGKDNNRRCGNRFSSISSN